MSLFYNSRGQIARVIDPLGQNTTFEYSKELAYTGSVPSLPAAPEGVATKTFIERANFLSRVVHPDGTSVSMDSDVRGFLSSRKDPEGNSTSQLVGSTARGERILPGGATIPAVHAERLRFAERSGKRAVALAAEGLRPSAVMTADALHNALVTLQAIGGSTNAVIHTAAIARRLGVPAPREEPIEFFLNGESQGTYALVEHISNRQWRSRFGHDEFGMRADQEIDARRSHCPGPLMELIRAVREAEAGTTLALLARNPGLDVPRWVEKASHQLLAVEDHGDHTRYVVRKAH